MDGNAGTEGQKGRSQEAVWWWPPLSRYKTNWSGGARLPVSPVTKSEAKHKTGVFVHTHRAIRLPLKVN